MNSGSLVFDRSGGQIFQHGVLEKPRELWCDEFVEGKEMGAVKTETREEGLVNNRKDLKIYSNCFLREAPDI